MIGRKSMKLQWLQTDGGLAMCAAKNLDDFVAKPNRAADVSYNGVTDDSNSPPSRVAWNAERSTPPFLRAPRLVNLDLSGGVI